MNFDQPPISNIESEEENEEFKLGTQLTHGGSSIVYELDDTHIAKEKLSSFAKNISSKYSRWKGTDIYEKINSAEKNLSQQDLNIEIENIKYKQEKIQNNLDLCQKYLQGFFLESELKVQNNRNGIPSIYIIQEKLQKGSKSMEPDNWNFKIDDDSRKNLQELIKGIEKMYFETSLMIDILTLSNVVYYPDKKQFHLFDADPLICSEENAEVLSKKYEVGSGFLNKVVTHLDNESKDCLEVNLEHLETLKSLLMTPEDYKK